MRLLATNSVISLAGHDDLRALLASHGRQCVSRPTASRVRVGRRRLPLTSAVCPANCAAASAFSTRSTIGLGSMIGAGIFAALAPAAAGRRVGAADRAGAWPLSSPTATRRPRPGWPPATRRRAAPTSTAGERLGRLLGLSGRLGIRGRQDRQLRGDGPDGRRLRRGPAYAHEVAVAAVVALTAINYVGVHKSARLTRVIVVTVLAVLAAVVVAVARLRLPRVPRPAGAGLLGVGRRAAGGRAAVLRLRRLRPDRHAGRGGP